MLSFGCLFNNLFAEAQIGLLVILLVAIGDYIVGSFIGPKNDSDLAKGFVGYSCEF